MKQISIIIALALLTTIANAQNIKGSHQVRANDEVKKQQVENRSESPDLSLSTQQKRVVDNHKKALRKEVKAIGKENKKLEENGKNY